MRLQVLRLQTYCIGIASLLASFAAIGDDETAPSAVMLTRGEAAPDFDIPDSMQATLDGEKLARLSDYRGRSVLVVFFPKAFSIGCTRQLTEYRNEYDVFEEADTAIIAISGDSPSETERFQKKHDLPFPVIGDTDHSIIEQWGVPSRAYLGMLYAQRCVFLVNPDGIIDYVEMDYSVIRSKKMLYQTIIDFAETRDNHTTPEPDTNIDP